MIALLSAVPILWEALREAAAVDFFLIPFIGSDLRDQALEAAGVSFHAVGGLLGGRYPGRALGPRRRILFLLDELEMGGTQKQVLLLGKALVAQGHQVVLAFFREKGAVLRDDFEAAGIDCILIPKRGRVDREFFFRLARLLRRERDRHIISFGYTANLWTRLAGILARSPRPICCIRDLAYLPAVPGRSILGRLEWLLSWLARRVVSNSAAAARAVAGRRIVPRRKISVISNAIEAAAFADRASARARLGAIAGRTLPGPVIGTLARLVPVKDLGTLLRAAREVVDRIPGALFIIGGEGPARAGLERLRDELRLRESVLLPGSLRGREVLAGLDLAVLTSLEEGSPNFILEAMAAGIPAVSTEVGEIPALLGHGERGWLVPPASPCRTAMAIVEALENPLELRLRAARARLAAALMTPGRLAAAYLSLLPAPAAGRDPGEAPSGEAAADPN